MNLKVGDKFKLKSNIYDADNEKQANNQTEVTIVGLFGGKIKVESQRLKNYMKTPF